MILPSYILVLVERNKVRLGMLIHTELFEILDCQLPK